MKYPRLTRPVYVTLLALLALSYLPLARIGATRPGATLLPSRNPAQPLVNFHAPQSPKFAFTGAAAAVAALQNGTANPTALAAADFDADGAVDVVAGYALNHGGALVLYKANPDAFAPTDTSLFQKSMKGNVPPTFLPTAQAFALPESPDFIVTGDFNLDGHKDVLVAARGGSLYFLAGDGRGNFAAPQPVALADQVTALAAALSEHVAVSTDGRSGPQTTILSPTTAGLSAGQSFSLPARATSLAFGSLGGSPDLAVGAGSNLVLIYNVLTASAQTETVNLPFSVRALALGDYIWDKDNRTEIAALAADGTIHILQHGTLRTGPLTAADRAARGAQRLANARGNRANRQTPNPTSLGAWTEAKQLSYAGSAPAPALSASTLSSPRLAMAATHDLLVIDAVRGQVNLLDTSGKAASPSAGIAFSATPVAALVTPQKINSGRDLVVLASGQPGLVLVPQVPVVYNVTTAADGDDAGACTSAITSGTGMDSSLSLREAACEVNNHTSGSFTINLPSGTYSLSDNASGETGEIFLGNLNTGLNISVVGSGTGTTIIQQTDGTHRVMEQDPQGVNNIVVSLSNLTLSGGNCTDNSTPNQLGPGDCSLGGGALLGAGLGDSLTLTSVAMTNNHANPTGDASGGGQDNGGALSHLGPNLTISNSTVSGNSSSGAGGGIYFTVGYFNLNYNLGSFSITNSSITNNTLTVTPVNVGGGFAFVTEPGEGASTISGSTFTGNTAISAGGGMVFEPFSTSGPAGSITVSNSRIFGNHTGGLGGTGVYTEFLTVILDNNWWGCNTGPNTSGCDTWVDDMGAVTENHWLVLAISANPTSIVTNSTSTLTADLTHNESGTSGFSVPNGTPVGFSGTLDSSLNPSSTTTSSGQATSTYTAGNSSGNGSGIATVDNQTVSVAITIGTPPTITSANNTTFTLGTAGTFTVTTTGSPAPSLSDIAATLPAGVTFVDNGNGTAKLSGPPATAGSYHFQITAHNIYSPDATQQFTLNVPKANPSIAVTSVAPSSEVYGQDAPVTITAVLSWSGSGTAPTPGHVTITGNGLGSYGATSCGSPSSDTLTCTATFTPTGADTAGSYTETASFSGDSNYNSSSSSGPSNFAITQASTTTSIDSSLNPSATGQSVTFTATVTGQPYGLIAQHDAQREAATASRLHPTKPARPAGGPTGMITWGANTGCAPSSLSGNPGTAQCVTTTLPSGPDSITASYGGDTSHIASSATPYIQNVNQSVIGTTIAVTSVSPSSEAYATDTSITITAVLSWTGSGTPPTAGNVTIGGNGPSGNYSSTSCGSPSGDTLTCTATYTPSSADTVASYTESASFTTDSNYTGSTSTATNNFTITQANTGTSIGSSLNPSNSGQSVTFTATVTDQPSMTVPNKGPHSNAVTSAQRTLTHKGLNRGGQTRPLNLSGGSFTGTMTWSANTGCAPSTVSGNPGTAQCVTTTLPSGPDSITASYGGDTNHAGSSATPYIQNVNQSVTGTTIAVTSVSPSSEVFNQNTTVTITAVLSWTGSGTPPTAGNVTIGGNGPSANYSGTSCGSPSSDTLTCTASYTPTSADTVGSYTESASFTSDSNYTGSNSTATNNFAITQANSATSISSSQNPSTSGQLVTFTATIADQMLPEPHGAVRGARFAQSNPRSNQKLNLGNTRGRIQAGATLTWSPNTGCAQSSVPSLPATVMCMTSTLPPGNNVITAAYSGDTNNAGSSGTLSGGQQVNGSFTVNPPSIDFGTVDAFTSQSQMVTLTNNSATSVNLGPVTLTRGAGTAKNVFSFANSCPSVLTAMNSCSINVTFTPHMPGTPSATLNIPNNAPGAQQTVPLSGTVIDPMARLSSTSINFAKLATGKKLTKTVTLSNPGMTPLIISSIGLTGADPSDFQVSTNCPNPGSLAPRTSCGITVTFFPQTTGPLSATVAIIDNAPPTGEQDITLKGVGK